MLTRSFAWAALAAGLMLLPSGASHAAFTYSTVVNVANDTDPLPTIPPGVTGINQPIGNGNALLFGANTIVLPITPEQIGGADINFGTVSFQPSPTSTTPTPFSVNYIFRVTFTDTDTGESQFADFTGRIYGVATSGAGNPSAITSTILPTGVNPVTLDFGPSGTLTLTNKGGTGPGSSPFNTLTDGVFQGNIITSVPEPASLGLVGVGLVFALAMRRRLAVRPQA